jgi:hypothetical protein
MKGGRSAIKQKILVLLIAVSILTGLVLPSVRAANDIYFTAVNDEILPLKDETMPTYINNVLYLPFTVFSGEKLGVYFAPSSDLKRVLIFSGTKQLFFDAESGLTYDEHFEQLYFSAIPLNGTIYLPAKRVCDYFELDLTVIQHEPAPIIRVKSAAAIFNDPSLPNYQSNKLLLKKYYNDYIGADTGAGATPSPATPAAPTTPAKETYERVTIYLSFYNLSGGMLDSVLNLAADYGYRCCFFVAADEIAGNADALRRAAGEGHSVGIWLKTGAYSEYHEAAGLLYEAAKQRTLLVSSPEGVRADAKNTAGEHGLVYWHPTRQYDAPKTPLPSSVTSRLSVLGGSRESLQFACTEGSLHTIGYLMDYLTEKQYTVRRITETTAPTIAID